MFDHYIGCILTTKIRLQSRKDCTARHRLTIWIFWLRESVRAHHQVGSLKHDFATLRCMIRRGRENSLNITGANFSARLMESLEWAMTYVYCAKNIAYVNIAGCLNVESRTKGWCALLFYCCFGHYWMLAHKISACEVNVIWWKPTEAFKIRWQSPSRGLESQQWSH